MIVDRLVEKMPFKNTHEGFKIETNGKSNISIKTIPNKNGPPKYSGQQPTLLTLIKYPYETLKKRGREMQVFD